MSPTDPSSAKASGSNFIRNIIDADLAANKFAPRRWSGRPGPAEQHKVSLGDTPKIRTRFPPEPNGCTITYGVAMQHVQPKVRSEYGIAAITKTSWSHESRTSSMTKLGHGVTVMFAILNTCWLTKVPR